MQDSRSLARLLFPPPAAAVWSSGEDGRAGATTNSKSNGDRPRGRRSEGASECACSLRRARLIWEGRSSEWLAADRPRERSSERVWSRGRCGSGRTRGRTPPRRRRWPEEGAEGAVVLSALPSIDPLIRGPLGSTRRRSVRMGIKDVRAFLGQLTRSGVERKQQQRHCIGGCSLLSVGGKHNKRQG